MARYRNGSSSWTCTVESVQDDRAEVSIRVRFKDHMEHLVEVGFRLVEDVYDERIDSWYADLTGDVSVTDLEEVELRPAVGARLDFAQLRRGHEERVALWLERMIGGEIEPLVDEVFEEVARRLPEYRGDASLTLWLHNITREVAAVANRRTV